MSHPEQALTGSVAIVTGAGRGLGRALALALARAGARIVLAARHDDDLADVSKEITEAGGHSLVVPTDVTDPAAVVRLVDQTTSEFGRIDVLVNNAGALRSAPIVEMTDDDWDIVLRTNLYGTFHCARAVGPTFITAGRGKVINIASAFAYTTWQGFTAYAMTKAALVHFTKSLAREWAPHGIQVNAIAPGFFETDINAAARADEQIFERILRRVPTGRFGQPDELGSLAVYLSSDASDYVTGATFVVDGGLSA